MKTQCYVLLLLTFFSQALNADADPNLTLDNSENPVSIHSTTQIFIDSTFLDQTLSLSIAFIDSELTKLQAKPFRLSPAEIDLLKQDLYIRYHPQEVKKTLSLHLQQSAPDSFSELNTILSSEFAKQLNSARLEASKPEETQNILNYQQELDLEAIQQHRLQIARTYDGLQKLSITQTLLLQHIQNTIYKNLNEKARSRYKLVNDTKRMEEILHFNQSLNLYAFRQVPAKDFIAFFNALAAPEVQEAMNIYEQSLKKTLDDRVDFEYLIENQ